MLRAHTLTMTSRPKEVRLVLDQLIDFSGCLPFYVSDRVDEIRLRYGGWFLVLLAVLLTLATVLFAAMASYCFFYQHGAFTGHWYWVNWGIEVAVECRT